MQMNLIDCFFLLSLIAVREGSGMLWKMNEFVALERTVKTILESCYEDDRSNNPIIIMGDFNQDLDNSSIIRIDETIEEDHEPFDFKASSVVLVENSLEELHTDLEIVLWMEVWNHMTSFFIIAKYNRGCEDTKFFLNLSWSLDIIDSIYICSESLNTSTLYTLNSMANYAPYPWERMEEPNNSNVFRQVFDQRISCQNLNYDKTRYLNGYEVKVVGTVGTNSCVLPPSNNCEFGNPYSSGQEFLQMMIITFNASARFENEINSDDMIERWTSNELDITRYWFTLSSTSPGSCVLSTYLRSKVIGIVKSKLEVTTLYKIFKLWRTSVLIVAAIAVAVLLLIMTIMNHNLSLALLDVVRLLTYTSIRMNARTHAFRIYFTTMLIFIVISNGVFQGKIAAFLTTRERPRTTGTINELANLGYKMFAVGNHEISLNDKCPKCNFEPALPRECVEHVLKNTHHLCALYEDEYYASYSTSELDYIPEILDHDFAVYGCRDRWPLTNRFRDGFSRLFEAGISDYLDQRLIEVPKRKHVAGRAELSSAQYRPVKLYKLEFAFQVLALGLLISTIVFIWELVQGEYGTARKSSKIQPTLRYRENSITKKIIRSLRYRRTVVLNGYFSKYPLTIRQDYMSRVRGISQLLKDDTYRAGKFNVFRKKLYSLPNFHENSK